MIRITADTGQVNAALTSIVGRLRNPKPMYASIGELLLRRTQARFKEERDPSGRPWSPLAPSTLERKRKQGRILKILQERGDMRGSLTYQADDRGVTVGYAEDSPKAEVHQFGSRRVPARPHLGLEPKDQDAILAIIQDFIG